MNSMPFAKPVRVDTRAPNAGEGLQQNRNRIPRRISPPIRSSVSDIGLRRDVRTANRVVIDANLITRIFV